MDNITLGLLLDYLYNQFAVTFILSLVGASMREVFVTNRNRKNHIKISKLLMSAIFSTIVLCAIGGFYRPDFSVYVLVCVIFGLWSEQLISNFVLNKRFMFSFMVNFLKKLGGSVSKAFVETMDEENNNKKSNRYKRQTKLIMTDTSDVKSEDKKENR